MNIPFGHERDNRAMRSAGLPLLLLAALSIGPAQGQWLRWPPQPASPVNAATPDAPAAAVRLRFARQGAMREVWADNDLSGPVEVSIDSARGQPGFPLQRARVSSSSSRIWARPTNSRCSGTVPKSATGRCSRLVACATRTRTRC